MICHTYRGFIIHPSPIVLKGCSLYGSLRGRGTLLLLYLSQHLDMVSLIPAEMSTIIDDIFHAIIPPLDSLRVLEVRLNLFHTTTLIARSGSAVFVRCYCYSKPCSIRMGEFGGCSFTQQPL